MVRISVFILAVWGLVGSASAQRTRTFQPPLRHQAPELEAVRSYPSASSSHSGALTNSPSTFIKVRPYSQLTPTSRIVGVRPLGAAPLPHLVHSSIRVESGIRVESPPQAIVAKPRRMHDVGFELSLLPYGPQPMLVHDPNSTPLQARQSPGRTR